MNLNQFLDHVCAPAFASDEKGRIIGWSDAAAELLGHPADSVVGRPCHEVICGLDPAGNRYCREDCNLHEMVQRREPICSFQLQVRDAEGGYRPVTCSAVALCEEPGCKAFQIVHVFYPQDHQRGEQRLADTESNRHAARPAREKHGSWQTDVALTRREAEVLRLMAEGDNTHDIADTLAVSPHTVRNHIQNILHKLNSHSRLQAIVQAQEQQLI